MCRICALITVLLVASSAAAATPRPMSVIPVVGRDGAQIYARVGGKILHTPNGIIDTSTKRAAQVYLNPSMRIAARPGGAALTLGEWHALGVTVSAVQPSSNGRITGLMLVTGSGFNAAAAARLGMPAARPGQIIGFASPRSGTPTSYGTALGHIGAGL